MQTSDPNALDALKHYQRPLLFEYLPKAGEANYEYLSEILEAVEKQVEATTVDITSYTKEQLDIVKLKQICNRFRVILALNYDVELLDRILQEVARYGVAL